MLNKKENTDIYERLTQKVKCANDGRVVLFLLLCFDRFCFVFVFVFIVFLQKTISVSYACNTG